MTTMTITMTMMLLACPSDFAYNSASNTCLKLATSTADWSLADDECHNLHVRASLVVIKDNGKQTAVENYLKSLDGKSVPKETA